MKDLVADASVARTTYQDNHSPIRELYAAPEDVPALKAHAASLLSWDLTPRQLCDLSLIRI